MTTDHAHHHSSPGEHATPDARALNRLAVTATAHCLTGCAIGEVLGLAIGTALGWGNVPTIALAVGLASFFGYLLTSIPLLRSGLALSAVVPLALASDTISIAIMEIVEHELSRSRDRRRSEGGAGHPAGISRSSERSAAQAADDVTEKS